MAARDRAKRPGIAHRKHLNVDRRHAHVLAELEGLIEAMLELVADHGLVVPNPVERRFAGVGTDRNATVGVGEERTVRRQVLVDLAVKAVALRAGQHCEAGVGGRLPREARRYEIALLLVHVDKRVAFARQADEAIEKFAILIDGTGDIEGPLNPIEAACLCLHLAALLSGRALAHHIENAAGRRLAVNARRGSFENLDSFEPVRLCPWLSELDRRIVRQAQAVKIARRDKATDLDLGVEHGRRAVQTRPACPTYTEWPLRRSARLVAQSAAAV